MAKTFRRKPKNLEKIKQFSKKDLIVDAQHSALKYWPVEELLAADNVHENTKAYFIDH